MDELIAFLKDPAQDFVFEMSADPLESAIEMVDVEALVDAHVPHLLVKRLRRQTKRGIAGVLPSSRTCCLIANMAQRSPRARRSLIGSGVCRALSDSVHEHRGGCMFLTNIVRAIWCVAKFEPVARAQFRGFDMDQDLFEIMDSTGEYYDVDDESMMLFNVLTEYVMYARLVLGYGAHFNEHPKNTGTIRALALNTYRAATNFML